MDIKLASGTVLALTLAGAGALAAPDGIELKPGFAVTFSLMRGTGSMTPGTASRGSIGPADPAPGQVTVGLAPSGGAVGAPRLHVYEHVPKAVTFTATALAGTRQLEVQTVCGRVEMDAWVTLPMETTRVVISNFTEAARPCD